MGEYADMDVEAWESGYPADRSYVQDGYMGRGGEPAPTPTIILRLKDGSQITVRNTKEQRNG